VISLKGSLQLDLVSVYAISRLKARESFNQLSNATGAGNLNEGIRDRQSGALTLQKLFENLTPLRPPAQKASGPEGAGDHYF